MSNPTARDLAEPVVPLAPGMSCAEVFERLLDEGDLLNIPVVENGRPLGLVSRQDFLLVYVRMFGREIYGRQCITALMNKSPVIVDAGMNCEDINARLFATTKSSPLQGFIVEENGRYLGLGSAATLMRVTADIIMRRAEELERQRRRAEAANESKTQFLAGMSHELRTPLNAIIGFADLMRMQLLGPLEPPRYLDYVNDIHHSGVHLLHMINELLDMAKIEAGHVDLHEDVIDLRDIGTEVLRMLRQSIETARVKLNVVMPSALPLICADEQQVRRVLVNLLSNAIKFTPAGGSITLSAHECESGLEVSVADTGIGIPPDKLDKVLEPFEQVENSFTRTRAGTGLGLPLTKAMVEAHGGTLTLESELGQGTTVRVSLPSDRIVRSEKIDAA
ncbi:MAG TPA: ATP-binding protein [Parvibaculum sp.]|jgi:two-component system cell cycle sensor histidine kinase PleC